MSRPVATVAALVLLAGCASPIHVSDATNRLLDKPEAEVVRMLGPPHGSGLSDDPTIIGGKTLVSNFVGASERLNYDSPFASLARSRCTVIFHLDAGRVKYSTLRGDACR
jgi:hypothetical protein